MKICMIGAGYVGLVSAACFSEFGWTVTCVDKDANRLARAQGRQVADLRAGPRRAVSSATCRPAASLSPTTSVRPLKGPTSSSWRSARRCAAATAMPTCPTCSAAVEELAPHLKGFTVVDHKIDRAGRHQPRDRAPPAMPARPTATFAVCSNPEFLREGSAIQDFMHPDRVLVGADESARREK